MVLRLNQQQRQAVEHDGNAIVTACPGSGKTRVLTARVIRGLADSASSKKHIVALTFTNRASDEIKSRLDGLGIEHAGLWAGTIHSFALEWILRPYAPYDDRLRYGFRVADERYQTKVLDALRAKHGQTFWFAVNTRMNREGVCQNPDPTADLIAREYREQLRSERLIDYDEILYHAHRLVSGRPEIAATVGGAIALMCVDEIQDTQDLQYAILSGICRAAEPAPTIFLVGDSDQCIYESLGAVLKSPEEIATEFGLDRIERLELNGNYRSTQRLIDHYRCLRPCVPEIKSLADYADDWGVVSFQDKTIPKDDLPAVIAGLIAESLSNGVPANEICVLAPQWWHVRAIGRSLAALLPDVDFDAPGLSPLHGQRENPWFNVARLLLTTPSADLFRARSRWAAEILRDFKETYGRRLPEEVQTPRQLLRVLNSLEPESLDGLQYLDTAFRLFLAELGMDLDEDEPLQGARDVFFEQAELALDRLGDDAFRDTEYFRKLFRHPSGIVINTCHGVKGEEYDTVIAFGLLTGYVPNWNEIYNQPPELGESRASRLLFVICSRAKRRLHLIAESGRLTNRGWELETTPLLAGIDFEYDPPRAEGRA